MECVACHGSCGTIGNSRVLQPDDSSPAGIHFYRQSDEREQGCHGEQTYSYQHKLRERINREHAYQEYPSHPAA